MPILCATAKKSFIFSYFCQKFFESCLSRFSTKNPPPLVGNHRLLAAPFPPHPPSCLSTLWMGPNRDSNLLECEFGGQVWFPTLKTGPVLLERTYRHIWISHFCLRQESGWQWTSWHHFLVENLNPPKSKKDPNVSIFDLSSHNFEFKLKIELTNQ